MKFETVQGPTNYVRVQIPQFDKIFHFFGDIHAVGTHCKGQSTSLPELVDHTLKYYEKNEKIDIYYEIGLGLPNSRVNFHNTYIAHFLRYFNKKGCFYQPRDVQCEIEYPNAQFHSVDYRETLKMKINEKIGKFGKHEISDIKNAIFEEMIPFLEKYQRDGFILEKEFIFLNFILHILGENPDKYKTYIYNNSLNFAGALYILIKDPSRMRMYIDVKDVKDGNKMKKIPGIDDIEIDNFFLFYPFYELHRSLSKLDDSVKNRIYRLIRQRIQKWSQKPDYSQWLRDTNFDLNAFGLDECSEMLDFYVLIRLFKSSQNRVILYMGSDHVRSVIHLLESLSLNDLSIYEFAEDYKEEGKDVVEMDHKISQCISVPVLKLSVLSMDYMNMDDIIYNQYKKGAKNVKINNFYQNENVADINKYYKSPGNIGRHSVKLPEYNKYLHLPKEKQLEMISIENQDELLASLSSLSFRPRTKSVKKSVKNRKKSVRKTKMRKSCKNKKNKK